MLPTINGKPLHECGLADIQLMLNNPDYSENAYLDFKSEFSLHNTGKDDKQDPKTDKQGPKAEKKDPKAEFRRDVCAFANSDGGYLVYGISEKNGIPEKITGITIPNNNPDNFELQLNNTLSTIMPKPPSVQFKFLKLSDGKYILILYIRHDFFAPYIHLENQRDYQIHRRGNNQKQVMSYMELKTMFTQSLSLEDEILHFRKNRIQYYHSQEDTSDHRYSRFALLHIIPDTFSDSNYSQNLFVLGKRKGIDFHPFFYESHAFSYTVPNVDGLKGFESSTGNETSLYNNGIAECFWPLEAKENYLFGLYDELPKAVLYTSLLWDRVEKVIQSYGSVLFPIFNTQRYFICLSVIGCRDIISSWGGYDDNTSIIDRDEVLCPVTVFMDMSNHDETEKNLKFLKLNSYLALSIDNRDMAALLKELYP